MSCTGKGKGDMETVTLKHELGGEIEIYLHGATVVSWKSAEGKDLIFCSPGAIFDGKKAIRGGVPVVFPQFGQPDKAMPQHGFARNTLWKLGEVKDTAEEARAVFLLSDSPATQALWPHAFALEYTVTLSAVGLNLKLRVANSGDKAFNYMCLLHTYLQVPDIKTVTVAGLKGRIYGDKVKNEEGLLEDRAEIDFQSFTDRVYEGATPSLKSLVVKSAAAPVFAVTCEARAGGETTACDVVLWNPYEEASPGDLPVPAFKEFICVEPGLVAKFHELAPGAVTELSQNIMAF